MTASHSDPPRGKSASRDSSGTLTKLWSRLRDLRETLDPDWSSSRCGKRWTEAIRNADHRIRSILRDLARFGLPVPVVRYKLQGVPDAMAEAGWSRPRVAIFTPEQKVSTVDFRAAGWFVQDTTVPPATIGLAICTRIAGFSTPVGAEESSISESDTVRALAHRFILAALSHEPHRGTGQAWKSLDLNWARMDRADHRGIVKFLERATHPNPDKRYVTAQEALADLTLHAPASSQDNFQTGKRSDKITTALDNPETANALKAVSKVINGSPAKSVRQGLVNHITKRDSTGLFNKGRNMLVRWLRRQLIGPADEKALLKMSPVNRYPVGVLHPTYPFGSGIDPADSDRLLDSSEKTGSTGVAEKPEEASPVRKRRFMPPSSAGVSFFIRGDARIMISARATVYKHDKEYDRDEKGQFLPLQFIRAALDELSMDWRVSHGSRRLSREDCGGNEIFEIDARSTVIQDGLICTVSLSNPQHMGSTKSTRDWAKERAKRSLFEAELECIVESGQVAEFPRVDEHLLSKEEQELELQYESRSILAVGHGAAAAWDTTSEGKTRIRTDFLPSVEVPLVTTELAECPNQVLSMHFLAKTQMDYAAPRMEHFVNGYKNWVESRANLNWPKRKRVVADRILKRMHVAIKRMRRGIKLLRTDRTVAKAFCISNQAMLDQMRQHDRLNNREQSDDQYRWRPFQLAFLLTVLESSVRENDDFRGVLDLIWFPTGGGKTEAYLGLIAFLIAWRRMSYRDTGAGTTVLMRYTLRLLTKQQFERATRMIFAMEILRQRDPTSLGQEPITAGLWVGESASPNKFSQAKQLRDEILDGKDVPNGLTMSACLWCGSKFGAANYCASREYFAFHCYNEQCEFGKDNSPLPCNIVDEALYRDPPTFLIGTVDKFARLAWEERAGVFFGRNSHRPPELVIQDELHLITGPLGSIAGLYEAAFDTIIKAKGVRPKYIASTATIHKAEEQVRRLYGRELAVFPPPGVSCDDCYFARSDRSRPGRLYVGYLAPMLGQRYCLVPLTAALLCGPQEVFTDQSDQELLLEAWWTQLIYHTSLASVGNSHNAYVTNVRDWTAWLTNESALKAASERTVQPAIAQLTSAASAQENAQTFDRLTRKRGNDGCLDVVLATNMISVGVDISRLALMVVNGQPLTTTEYIQASSRVGRSEVPGIVFANYLQHQARSLAHYEIFRPYHESFYRFVESASVTPFTLPVRDRALHATLVIALRHTCNALWRNKTAGEICVDDPQVREVVDTLKRRFRDAASGEGLNNMLRHLDKHLLDWGDHAQFCRSSMRALHYDAKDRSADSLLCSHDNTDKGGLWPTMHSMRNVESTGVLKEDGTNESIQVRLSSLLRYCSVGAIVHGKRHLMVVKDTTQWFRSGIPPPNLEIRYVEQVRRVLGIRQKLCMPPKATLDYRGNIQGRWIPAMRFPTWMFCPRCGLLHEKPWANKEPEKPLKCQCKTGLEQVPWVMVHKNGYLADVPWHMVTHKGSSRSCLPPKSRPYLELNLIKRKVKCNKCKAKNTLPLHLPFPRETNEQPWLSKRRAKDTPAGAELVKINDVRVYSPVTEDALVIPPESRIRKGTVVDRLYCNSKLRRRLLRKKLSKLRRKAELRSTAQDWRCTPGEIMDAARQIEDGGYPLEGQEIPGGGLLESEYKALTEEIPDLQEDEDLVTQHHTDKWAKLATSVGVEARKVTRAVNRLVEVRRLRAIRVFKGFRRSDRFGFSTLVEPDIKGTANWLPAMELRGEGIFFTLDEGALQRWENQKSLKIRAKILLKRHNQYGSGTLGGRVPEVSPRFLLLHTLAHLLLRQFESEAGYPAASLRERIYCGSDDNPMSGILIFLAVTDMVGSLGGLAELAAPRHFLRFLAAAWQAAAWCSLDPVCARREGHGPGLLNLAACHACALVPETSCDHGNVLLDRSFVQGDSKSGIRSILDFAGD